MPDVIDFLERMGQDAQLHHATLSDVEFALTRAQLDPEIRAAILAKDQPLLEALLGSSNVFCGLLPGKQDEEEGEDDDSEETPRREDSEISSLAPPYLVASAG